MSQRVPSSDIERIVGATRHPWLHFARAVSAEQTVYVLHARRCLNMDLRGEQRLQDCPYSVAMDRGIPLDRWPQDQAVEVAVEEGTGLLIPCPAHPVAKGS